MIDPNVCAPRPAERRRLPPWLKRPLAASGTANRLSQRLSDSRLHTVCAEARCPNQSECFGRGTATFLILGDTCTRNCGFCGIGHGSPAPVDKDEPRRVVEAVARMGITHAVITSVTRDDLADGGAGQFAEVITRMRRELPNVSVEVLVPDFAGNNDALDGVLDARPDVFNHNVETVPRLYPSVRPGAEYRRSLRILARAAGAGLESTVKSGLMVGLGETEEEVHSALADMRAAGCVMVTIGQYLRPSQWQLPVVAFVAPPQFEAYREYARGIGFAEVSSAPFVRSSYRAGELLGKVDGATARGARAASLSPGSTTK
jgi:lipoic acid synthetase